MAAVGRRGLILLLAFGLSGCRSGQESEALARSGGARSAHRIEDPAPVANTVQQMKTTTKKQLIVSKENDAEEMIRLGTIDFDGANQATLSTEGTGQEVEELKQAWAEISKTGDLTWKQSRPDTIDGESVTRIVGVKAKPGDEAYIYAVMNTLERKYGYTVDIAR
jgi:hypothetical protein